MKNNFKVISVLLSVIFLAACSYNYQLEIVNHSAQPLKITYKIKAGKHFQPLYVMSVEDWKQKNEPKPMTADSFVTDEAKLERIVTLSPNQVVVLEKGLWNPEGVMLDVIEIKLSGTNGEMNFSGERFYKNFEKENSTFYTIEYK